MMIVNVDSSDLNNLPLKGVFFSESCGYLKNDSLSAIPKCIFALYVGAVIKNIILCSLTALCVKSLSLILYGCFFFCEENAI